MGNRCYVVLREHAKRIAADTFGMDSDRRHQLHVALSFKSFLQPEPAPVLRDPSEHAWVGICTIV